MEEDELEKIIRQEVITKLREENLSQQINALIYLLGVKASLDEDHN